ncbi:hypothetical protein [Terriglobus tenax]|uniref:hypothetical protein n=1 Tax=Terriglobus tenax TaxID=1111115 RepID=UPI0021E083A1|nr:hypothetical protein [Terriglobus tenax]
MKDRTTLLQAQIDNKKAQKTLDDLDQPKLSIEPLLRTLRNSWFQGFIGLAFLFAMAVAILTVYFTETPPLKLALAVAGVFESHAPKRPSPNQSKLPNDQNVPDPPPSETTARQDDTTAHHSRAYYLVSAELVAEIAAEKRAKALIDESWDEDGKLDIQKLASNQEFAYLVIAASRKIRHNQQTARKILSSLWEHPFGLKGKDKESSGSSTSSPLIPVLTTFLLTGLIAGVGQWVVVHHAEDQLERAKTEVIRVTEQQTDKESTNKVLEAMNVLLQRMADMPQQSSTQPQVSTTQSSVPAAEGDTYYISNGQTSQPVSPDPLVAKSLETCCQKFSDSFTELFKHLTSGNDGGNNHSPASRTIEKVIVFRPETLCIDFPASTGNKYGLQLLSAQGKRLGFWSHWNANQYTLRTQATCKDPASLGPDFQIDSNQTGIRQIDNLNFRIDFSSSRFLWVGRRVLAVRITETLP